MNKSKSYRTRICCPHVESRPFIESSPNQICDFGEGLKFHVLALLRRTPLTRLNPAGLPVTVNGRNESESVIVWAIIAISLGLYRIDTVTSCLLQYNTTVLMSSPSLLIDTCKAGQTMAFRSKRYELDIYSFMVKVEVEQFAKRNNSTSQYLRLQLHKPHVTISGPHTLTLHSQPLHTNCSSLYLPQRDRSHIQACQYWAVKGI